MKRFLVLVFCILVTFISCTKDNGTDNKKVNKFEIIGFQYITEENRDFIGTQTVYSDYFLDINTKQYKLENNPIIKNMDPDIHLDSALASSSNFIVKEENNKYITPEVIGTNGSVGIFTKKDNSGWMLNKGQVLTINFNKYKSKIVENQTVVIGYIVNGRMVNGQSFRELSGTYKITSDEPGEYYIYIVNASSEYIAFKEGDITVS